MKYTKKIRTVALSAALLFVTNIHAQWQSVEMVDEMTDEVTPFVGTIEIDVKDRYRTPAKLVIMCAPDEGIKFVVHWNEYGRFDHYDKMEYRIDKNDIVKLESQVFSSYQMTSTAAPDSMIRELIKGTTLVTRVFAKTGVRKFSLVGFTRKFKKTCKDHPDFSRLMGS